MDNPRTLGSIIPLNFSTTPSSEPKKPSAETLKAAKVLFGCYRTGDANDPQVYTAAVVAVLSDYSPEVVQFVTDPRTGLPSKVKWLPAVAEVKEACEERRLHLVRVAEGERWKARLAASRAISNAPPTRLDLIEKL